MQPPVSGEPSLPAGKPVPSIVEDRPAPADTLGLDRAETTAAEKPGDYRAQLYLGYSLYKSQAFSHAARAFEKAAQLKPEDSTALLFLGYAQMGLGDQDAAIAAFQKITERKETDRETLTEAYLQIGDAHYLLGRDDAAREAFSKSLGNNPRQARASLALGTLAAQKGQYEQARDFFRDALNDAKNSKTRSQALACLGLIAQQARDSKGAKTFYEKALNIDPSNEAARRSLASLNAPAKK